MVADRRDKPPPEAEGEAVFVTGPKPPIVGVWGFDTTPEVEADVWGLPEGGGPSLEASRCACSLEIC